ncbi:uncharacterized protein BYT42DRAFT_540711 [Radiomyces spectabilis]|uniref:uncharacterized protein n=1 Tax=Radiomyces spectabilis TaxID=64574 RepID=UPI0022205222|nr:uncharacterized protein BYT42DRAFT_540711 [Radiomyces spectabilis]KAI8366079.1 hypothetical protein BYT42DRAFT_540711 [Radiomyces spectabilis]
MSQEDPDVDLRNLTYTDNINANLICCICQSPFIDPVISPCGHTFCRTCICKALETSDICPIDRSALSLSELQPAVKIVCNMVNELSVYCPRAEQGCEYTGQRQLIQGHLKHDCLYTLAACQQEECKELVLKKDIHRHAETCKYRRAQCNMCKKHMRAFELEDHHKLCPAETIQCPHCNSSRSRSQHAAHLTVCPQHPVSCPHAEFGCQWTGERQQLETTHIEHCAYEGIKHYLYKQKEREQTLRDELRLVRSENDVLKRRQGELHQHIESLTDQLSLLLPQDPGLPEEARPNLQHSVLSETRRLKNEVDELSANMQSLELKQNVALMEETFRLQEEMQALRAICHGMRMQMHFVMMERRGSNTASSSTSAPVVSNSTSSVTDTNASISALSRMRSWLDTSGIRQETKL